MSAWCFWWLASVNQWVRVPVSKRTPESIVLTTNWDVYEFLLPPIHLLETESCHNAILPSLMEPQVVITTNCSATSDNKVSIMTILGVQCSIHDGVIKWKHFSRYWPFVGLHRSPVNSRHRGKWRGALMFSLIWAWTNSWAINGDAGDLKRHRAHYDVIVMMAHKISGNLLSP